MDAEGRANGADVIDETIETGRARSARGERCQCRTGDDDWAVRCLIKTPGKNHRPRLRAQMRCEASN